MPEPDQVRPADHTGFFTYRNPHDYHPDWAGFYDDALRRRDDVRRRLSHDVALKYGEHPFQLANVYHPENATAAPVIVYFHGGRWREGHPDHYDHFAEPWVEAGAVFISCGYRLEPEYTIGDSIDDAMRAVTWAAANAARFGGDPTRITVAGHSAGGHLAAMLTMTDWDQTPLPENGAMTGAVCMSPPTDLRVRMLEGPEAARYSPALRVTKAPAHVVVSFGEPEPNKKAQDEHFFADQGRLLVAALTDKGASPVTVTMPHTDHVATAAAFADTSSDLFTAARSAIFANGER